MSDERVRKAEALKKAKEEFMENNKSNATPFFVENQSNVSTTYKQSDLPELPAIHFRGCNNCNFTLSPGTTVVKVLLENCNNSTLTLDKCVVSTATLEIWRSDNCKLTVDCFLGTLQADLCKNTLIQYAAAAQLGSVVQAGMQGLTVKFQDGSIPDFRTGLEELRAEFGADKVNDDTDQFITRVVEGKLLTEPIIRLLNDFPTTAREKAEFDAQAAKKAEAMEKLAREMLQQHSVADADAAASTAPPPAEEDLSAAARAKFKKDQGNASFKAGDPQQAAVFYTEALLLDDKDHSLYSNRAACFLKLGLPAKALVSLLRENMGNSEHSFPQPEPPFPGPSRTPQHPCPCRRTRRRA